MRCAGGFWELEKAETHSPSGPPEGVSAGPSARAQGDPVWIPGLDLCPPYGTRIGTGSQAGVVPGVLLPSMPSLRAACALRLAARVPAPTGGHPCAPGLLCGGCRHAPRRPLLPPAHSMCVPQTREGQAFEGCE